MLIVSAPAKIILCGEHAVVYGFPAIAMPVFGLRARATVRPLDRVDFRIRLLDTGETLVLTDTDHPFISLVHRATRAVDRPVPTGIEIDVSSDIPIASGLGSGAAVASALVKSLFQHYRLESDLTRINALVYEAEQAFHGTPSGIDNTVIVYESPVYFVKGRDIEPISLKGKYHFVIANTGIPASTKETVAKVRVLYEQAPKVTGETFENIHSLVDQSRKALTVGDNEWLGSLLTQNHEQLQKLSVSTKQLDLLVAVALQAGAYGAKLSGGGGGGNMIALVSQDKIESVKSALLRSGAKRVYTTILE